MFNVALFKTTFKVHIHFRENAGPTCRHLLVQSHVVVSKTEMKFFQKVSGTNTRDVALHRKTNILSEQIFDIDRHAAHHHVG